MSFSSTFRDSSLQFLVQVRERLQVNLSQREPPPRDYLEHQKPADFNCIEYFSTDDKICAYEDGPTILLVLQDLFCVPVDFK